MAYNKEEIKAGVIEAYRLLINDRYQYDYLSAKYDIPASLDPHRIELFRNFFLDYIYPPVQKRKELNRAFDSLDQHIKNPKSLLAILLDSSRVLFKFGRHLPKILNAAIKALRSFKKADTFEERLAKEALSRDPQIPISQHELKSLVAALPKTDVMDFINESKVLFEIIQDRQLVTKIISLLTQLIKRMEKSSVYAQTDVNAFQIGLDIITGSFELFNSLSTSEAKQLFELGVEIERNEIERVYEEYGSND